MTSLWRHILYACK